MGSGRKPGSKNKATLALKEAILKAGERAGRKYGKDGLVSYLTHLANEHPQAFAPLLGKVLPLTVTGDNDAPITIVVRRFALDEDEAIETQAIMPPMIEHDAKADG